MIKQGTMTNRPSLDSMNLNDGVHLNQRKHIRAMKRANELLNENMYVANITDSLNCGKFNMKFLKALKHIFKSSH